MNTNLLAKRFRLLIATCAILTIALAAAASWKESGYNPNRSESSEATVLLDLGVRALVSLPEGNKPDYQETAFIKGLNDTSANLVLGSLDDLDKIIVTLRSSKRIKGNYILDLDRLVSEIKSVRSAKDTYLYGAEVDIVLGVIRQLKIGTTLAQLTWRENIPESKRTSEYWQQHVARAANGFVAQRNPWGPMSGSFLVRDSGTKAHKGQVELLQISGQQVEYPDGRSYDDVRQKFPEFMFPAEPIISDSMNALLDYDARGKLVDRKNHVILDGKSVPAGYDVVLTLDPSLQTLANGLADAALSGDHIKNATLVSMDIKSGEILAAASASERTSSISGSQALIFRTIAPASTSKIIFAATLLEQADKLKNSQKILSQLPYFLMISDPQRIFFTTTAFDDGAAKLIRDQSKRFGWNQDCAPGEACVGRPMDHLYGSSQNGASNAPLAGRILVAEGNKKHTFRLLDDNELDQLPKYSEVRPSLEDSRNQRPSPISNKAFEASKVVRMSMFGQGNARTSPFGLLLTISHVANAANGQKGVIVPHLVSQVQNADGSVVQTPRPGTMPVAMKPENARILAKYLTAVNSPQGTAALPFKEVFGKHLSDQEMLFAKTGTTDSHAEGNVPLYLYVASYSRNGKEYDTAVVAVCERKVKEGRSYNYAADLALRFIKATRGTQSTKQQATKTL